MKSYDMTNPTDNKVETVERHKKERENVMQRKNGIESETSASDENDDLDDLSENNDDVLRDSRGFEVKIEEPMWSQTNKRTNVSTDGPPSWQKSPSRMSTGEWFITLILLMIPILNLVLLIVWSFFSDTVPTEKRNYARASITLTAIVILIGFILGLSGGNKLKKVISNNTTSEIQTQMKESVSNELHTSIDEYNGLSDNDFTSD